MVKTQRPATFSRTTRTILNSATLTSRARHFGREQVSPVAAWTDQVNVGDPRTPSYLSSPRDWAGSPSPPPSPEAAGRDRRPEAGIGGQRPEAGGPDSSMPCSFWDSQSTAVDSSRSFSPIIDSASLHPLQRWSATFGRNQHLEARGRGVLCFCVHCVWRRRRRGSTLKQQLHTKTHHQYQNGYSLGATPAALVSGETFLSLYKIENMHRKNIDK